MRTGKEIKEAFYLSGEKDFREWIKKQPEFLEGDVVVSNKDKKLPPVAEQAKSFVKAATGHIMSGMRLVGQEEAERRWSLCLECERLVDGSRCGVCGCFMKIKSTWKTQRCPIEKW